MTILADLLRNSTALFAVVSVLDNFLLVFGCMICASSLFSTRLRRFPAVYVLIAAACIALGVCRPFAVMQPETLGEFLWSTCMLLLPFLSMTLLFTGKGRWKPMLVAAGYTFIEELRFVVLLLFFNFNYETRDEPLELVVEVAIDVCAFLFAVLLLRRYSRQNDLTPDLTRSAVTLFLLTTATVAVFITTLLLLGSAFSASHSAQFLLVLLNLPLLAVTLSVAAVTFFRMRTTQENYRQQLNMQIRQFAWMEQMNEEMRRFRHDFPKKLRPLVAYLDSDRPEDAREIAKQFGAFMEESSKTYHTGNYRLDTVLNCEQQLAQKDGIEITVPFDTVFPADGIDPDDIYTIFPNALDNAIEACRKVSGKREIFFRARMNDDTVYVTIRNPVAGEVKLKNGVPQTSKKDKSLHGYGFRSIKKAAAHYGRDNVQCVVEDGWFELRLFLRIGQ